LEIKPTDIIPGRTACVEGRIYRYFSGTSYLGMAQYEPYKAAVAEGVQRLGANFGGSRLGNIRFPIYAEAEAWLAAFAGAEAALTVSSGTAAGQVVLRSLEGLGPLHFAPGTHPALWGAGQYHQGRFADWAAQALQICQQTVGTVVLLSNAVDSIFARRYAFEWLHDLPAQSSVILVLDDSHSLGVCGPGGSGAGRFVQPPPQVELIAISSLGKALGVPGGVIFGRQERIAQFWGSPTFGGASPIPPAYLYAMLRMQEHYPQALGKLRANIRHFGQAIQPTGLFQSFEDYPVFYTPEQRLGPWLEERGCLISQFPYPTPADAPATRIVLNALHEKEDLDYLAAQILDFVENGTS
jgi:7-keto-8-aminopelargonate synthetase-like enzyme